MTPRERVLAAMAGEMPDRIPFVVWNNKLPGGSINQQLLDLEACIVNKSTVYHFSTPGIEIETEQLESKDACARKHIIYHTPAGVFSTTVRLCESSVWTEKMPFSGPDDYDSMEVFIRSKVYTACYDEFLKEDLQYPGQSLARPQTIYTPIQQLVCKYMGVQKFCIEWVDRRDRLLALCDVIADDRRKRLKLVADSPARFAVIEGNVIASVIGPERFEKYHIPYIEEACELLHGRGKWAGAHLDDNNKTIAPLVAKTSLDMIESFTPPPDCNLSLAEARRVWPEKTIQINFPSSIHLRGPAQVQKAAVEILHQAAPGNRFIIGVSEDISERGVNTLVPLAKAVYENGQTPIRAN